MCRRPMYLVSLALVLGLGLIAGMAGASEIKINFQAAGAPIPDGYLPDYGELFGDRGNGWSYGWSQDMSDSTRDRNSGNAPDQRYDTLIHFFARGAVWEIELPNGTYNLFLVCGDPSNADSNNQIEIEGEILADDPDGLDSFDEFELTVTITDGRLSWSEPAGSYVKPCFIEIEGEALTQFFRTARDPDPADGTEGIDFPIMMWTPGDTAVSQRVYFGPDPDALVQVAEQPATLYWHPEALEPGTTYYWRIDGVEADGNVITGDVWSFVTLSMIAWGESPSDGATNVMIDTRLSWKAGDSPYPIKHHVFFGTDEAAVAAGTGDTDKGVIEETTYEPEVLLGDTTYYFRVDEQDIFGEERAGDVWSFKTVAPGPGKIIREWWFDISGTTVSNLTSDPRYPENPDGLEFVKFARAPENWAEQFGSRFRGWLFPPETGDYTFLIEADDEGQIRLSPDQDPANAVMIASTAGEAESQAQSLVAGERYCFEALMKGGTIADLFVVSWQGPVVGAMDVISAKYVGATPYAAKKAYAAFPADGAQGTKQTTIVSWSAGVYAASHEVYFGTDAGAVAAATKASPEYKGSKQLGEESLDPGKLAFDTTYYWRVDEVDNANAESPWTGSVWSFWTGDFLVVDDFESYDDVDPAPGEAGLNRIFDKWIDGFGTTTNGALVGNDFPPYAEQTIVHSGAQALVYRYDNNLKTSEATLTLDWPRDWTEQGVTRLSLWHIGDIDNAAERMFVALNGTAVVYHENPDVALVNGWTEWSIDLT
ncbi:MAG: fibronectin type III domain-containing protein, partial [Planctomycetota bacterium]